jgi:hypothetical protein
MAVYPLDVVKMKIQALPASTSPYKGPAVLFCGVCMPAQAGFV